MALTVSLSRVGLAEQLYRTRGVYWWCLQRVPVAPYEASVRSCPTSALVLAAATADYALQGVELKCASSYWPPQCVGSAERGWESELPFAGAVEPGAITGPDLLTACAHSSRGACAGYVILSTPICSRVLTGAVQVRGLFYQR